MGQTLLFPDPKPLDQRLGRQFFQSAPERPGVYLMKDAHGRVLYVGKAKNLKQRINHYRLANPDRMPRRHLRMVRQVQRIEFQFCVNEAAALERESKLLRSLKPRFNRAGVWPGKTRFVIWRVEGSRLELGVAEVPGPGWRRCGPMNGSALGLHRACARLLWLALNQQSLVAGMPHGWAMGNLPDGIAMECADESAAVLDALSRFFWEEPADLLAWLDKRLRERTSAFERAVITADLESLENFSRKQNARGGMNRQMALL